MFKWDKMPVYFDGHDLSSILSVTSLNRGIGTSRSNNLLKAGTQKGKQYKDYTYDEKIIPMGFSLNIDIRNKRHELAKILNVNEPKELIFGDEPDKYYIAVPDGNIDLEEIAQTGKGIINWIIPAGVAYSKDFKTFTSDVKSPNEILVSNSGSEFSKPILEATFKNDNGFVSFMDNDGNIIQIGSPQEAEGVNYQESNKVLNESMITQGNWLINQGRLNYRKFGEGTSDERENVIEGEWDFTSLIENAIPIYETSVTSKAWNGPSLYQNLKQNSNNVYTGNFDFKTRFDFRNDKNIERGRIEFNLHNQSHQNIAYNITVRDSVVERNDMQLEFWYSGRLLHSIYLRPAGVKKNEGFWEARITKFGDRISYFLTRVTGFSPGKVNYGKQFAKSFTIAGASALAIHEVTLWAGRWRDTPNVYMDFTDCKFDWVNVEKWKDVPNLFSAGDVLALDTRSGRISLNGVNRPDLETFGNEWGKFNVKPGNSFIFTSESAWTKSKPDYKIYLEEVWI